MYGKGERDVRNPRGNVHGGRARGETSKIRRLSSSITRSIGPICLGNGTITFRFSLSDGRDEVIFKREGGVTVGRIAKSRVGLDGRG